MKQDHVSCLFKDIRMNKASWRPQSNTHKLKRVLFFIVDCEIFAFSACRHLPHHYFFYFLLSLPVIAWLESLIRLKSRFLVTRTRLESSWEKQWLDSTGVTFFAEWVESQSMTRDSSRSHFYKISEFLMDKASSFAHKEISIFCFSDDHDWRKFSVLPV